MGEGTGVVKSCPAAASRGSRRSPDASGRVQRGPAKAAGSTRPLVGLERPLGVRGPEEVRPVVAVFSMSSRTWLSRKSQSLRGQKPGPADARGPGSESSPGSPRLPRSPGVYPARLGVACPRPGRGRSRGAGFAWSSGTRGLALLLGRLVKRWPRPSGPHRRRGPNRSSER